MTAWPELLPQEWTPAVLVSVARVRGSAPREAGAGMLVTAAQIRDSIGGGWLEFEATARARRMLDAARTGDSAGEVHDYVLGPESGQCCGGVVSLHFQPVTRDWLDWLRGALDELSDAAREADYLACRDAQQSACALLLGGRLVAGLGPAGTLQAAVARLRSAAPGVQRAPVLLRSDEQGGAPATAAFCLQRPLHPASGLRLVLFGAGHVGRALVDTLGGLVEPLIWCDARSELFPAVLPSGVVAETGDPTAVIDRQPPGTCFLVMTHNHALDLVLCEAVLRRADAAYCGLIGSAGKRRRFEQALLDTGMTRDSLAGLTCPVGVAGIQDKRPRAIAIAVAAELLQLKHALAE